MTISRCTLVWSPPQVSVLYSSQVNSVPHSRVCHSDTVLRPEVDRLVTFTLLCVPMADAILLCDYSNRAEAIGSKRNPARMARSCMCGTPSLSS